MQLKSEIFNGSKFEDEKVKNIIERAYKTKQRLRLFYGNRGRCWNDEYDIMGTIGRSTGAEKIALLIHNSRSIGGGGILTDRIIGIFDTQSKQKLFWADGYEMPKATVCVCSNDDLVKKGYTHEVWLNNELYANCKSEKQAQKLADFMTVKRFSK